MNSNDGTDDELTLLRRWPLPRFSLLTLLLFMTLVCVALAYFLQPRQCEVEALFQVSARPITLLGGDSDRFDAREFEIFQQTQISLIKSYFVLQAAVRDRSIASLPILAGKTDPVAWLVDHIDVSFPHNAEVLSIRLRGPLNNASDLRLLVDAVAKAYTDEVLYRDAQEKLVRFDAMAKHVAKLREKIEKKMLELQGKSPGGPADDVEKSIRQMEIDILTDQWRDQSRALVAYDANSATPPRIRQIQPAVLWEE